MKKIISLIFTFFLANNLWAATITVTNTNDSGTGSLRDAFANAENGDEIRFDASLANQTIVLTSGELTMTKSITIDGIDATNLTLSGNNNSRILFLGWEFDASVGSNVPTVVNIKNLNFINGVALNSENTQESYQLEGAGGAIFVLGVGNTINVENCTFDNNTSHGWGGGAVYIANAGTDTFDNCLFTNNTTNTDDDTPNGDKGEKGGTLAAVGDATLTVKNSEFRNNKGVNGGGIMGGDINLLVENSYFENNDTKTFPLQYPNPSAMPPNRAYGYGGAIYTDGANRNEADKYQILRNCVFINNVAHGQGGAVYLYGYRDDEITVENCTFSQNEVVTVSYAGNSFSTGGGLAIAGGVVGSRTQDLNNVIRVLVRNNTFDNNRSYGQGGGFWMLINDNGIAEVANCTFANNQAFAEDPTNDRTGLGGGVAIVTTNNNITLNNLTIAKNLASHQGGGIYVNEGNNISMYNSIVAYNEARNAGEDFNITHNFNKEMNAGSNNIQTNEFGTDERFLGQLTPNTQTIDPLLEDLADNGGPTQTMALQAGSPAIDAGTNCIELDQRNATRQGACDLGAYEVGGVIENPILPPVGRGNEGNGIEVEAFNIITPNGDGQNDTWQIDNLSGTYKIRVFTKTGQLVFESEDYNIDTWDGTKDGQELPEGVYYYAISFEEVNDVKTGYVTLIK